MAETLTSKTTEFSAGQTGALALHYNDATERYHPIVRLEAGTLGGVDRYRFANAATTNATSIKAGPGQLYGWFITSVSPEANYLKFYDKASAPTVGSDSVVLAPVFIPVGSTTTQEKFAWFPQGIVFATGIACSLVEGFLDSDTAATDTANELYVTIFYK